MQKRVAETKKIVIFKEEVVNSYLSFCNYCDCAKLLF